MVEFALVVPILILLVLGIFAFGTAFNYKDDLTSLANTAARYAEVNSCTPCSTQPIDTYVQGTADSSALQSGGSSVTPVKLSFCFPSGSTGQVGDELKVTAAATYSWMPFLQGAVGSPSTKLAASVIVRVQSPYDAATPANNKYTATTCA